MNFPLGLLSLCLMNVPSFSLNSRESLISSLISSLTQRSVSRELNRLSGVSVVVERQL